MGIGRLALLHRRRRRSQTCWMGDLDDWGKLGGDGCWRD
jgi:hypothetical protein